ECVVLVRYRSGPQTTRPCRNRALPCAYWSGRGESNPRHELGELRQCHYTTPARAADVLPDSRGQVRPTVVFATPFALAGRSCVCRAGFAGKVDGRSDQLDFIGVQAAVMAGSQVGVEPQRPHAFAVQADDSVVEVAEHAFDLMMATFVQGKQGQVLVENFQFGRQGGEVLAGEVEAAGEDLGVLGGDWLFGGNPVDLAQVAARFGQAARPEAIVGEDQQP